MDKSTLRYIGKRLLMSALTLMIIVFVLFVMLKLMPGTPFNDEKLTEAQKALIYAKYGFDKPIWEQFITYFRQMLSGDFGISYGISRNLPVSNLVMPRIPISFGIGFAAVVLGTVIGILLGIFAALRRNTIWDSISTVIAVLGVSVPSFVLCLILLIAFGVKIPVFPILFNTLIPVITVLAPIMVALMTGSMVIEQICGIPGLGSLLVQSITVNDYNVTIAVAFIYSVMYIAMMLIVDILYGIIDPRIRLGKENGNE